jgi:hypothetical protein
MANLVAYATKDKLLVRQMIVLVKNNRSTAVKIDKQEVIKIQEDGNSGNVLTARSVSAMTIQPGDSGSIFFEVLP